MEKNITAVYSFQVNMLVHVVADTEESAKTQLDDKGGIVTKREVELLNTTILYGENKELN